MSFFILIPVTLLCIFIVVVVLIVTLNSQGNYLRKKKPSDYTDKIVVDFKDCYLLASSRKKEEYTPSTHDTMELLKPELYEQDTHPYKYFTSIVYEKDGRKFYSKGVNKSRTTVEYYMMMQSTTCIYFNRNNPDDYFFDISFSAELHRGTVLYFRMAAYILAAIIYYSKHFICATLFL